MNAYMVFTPKVNNDHQYTLVYLNSFENGVFFARECNSHPTSPNGIGMAFECTPEHLAKLLTEEVHLNHDKIPVDIIKLADKELADFAKPTVNKLNAEFAGAMLPDYWGGHHLPHISVEVTAETTVDELIGSLSNELDMGYIRGSDFDPESTNDLWYAQAHLAISAIRSTHDKPFEDLVPRTQDDDEPEIQAYFLFTEA